MANDVKHNTKFIVIVGWVSNIIALFFLPIIFGVGGIIFGFLLVKNKKQTHGYIMIIAAVIFAILGVLFGYIID